MLESDSDRIQDPEANPQTLAFLRRCAGVQRSIDGAHKSWQRLKESQVWILESSLTARQASCLKLVLEETGVGAVGLLEKESYRRGRFARGSAGILGTLMVSLTDGTEDCVWHAELDDWCSGR